MGYTTDFDIDFKENSGFIDSRDSITRLIKDLKEITNLEWEEYGDAASLGAGRWDDWEKDMKELSLLPQYDRATLRIRGEGSESGDLWIAYICKGKAQQHQAVITIPPFDPTWGGTDV